jgi:hypothetical protein
MKSRHHHEMKRKVSTIMEESLFRRAKLEAARQGRPMAAILEDALRRYFAGADRGTPSKASLVDASWGVFALPPDVVREIMDDEDDWLES